MMGREHVKRWLFNSILDLKGTQQREANMREISILFFSAFSISNFSPKTMQESTIPETWEFDLPSFYDLLTASSANSAEITAC